MTRCRVKDCPNRARPVPGALYCDRCHKVALAKARNPSAADIIKDRNIAAAFKRAGHPQPPHPVAEHDWTMGRPNATCPACGGRYHYGAPVPLTHLCPLCGTWVCWKDTGELKEKRRRVARKCPVCSKRLQDKPGRYGPWWGCAWFGKGHKDNCPGKRKWADCDVVVEMVPRLALAAWMPYQWTEMDQKAEDMAALHDKVEGFETWLKKVKRVQWGET